MNQKTKNTEAMGAGKGAPSFNAQAAARRARVLVSLGLVSRGEAGLYVSRAAVFPARDWSKGGAWEPVAIYRGARGGLSLVDLSPVPVDHSARAARVVARAVQCGRHVALAMRAASSVSCNPGAARRGGWLAGYESARADRLASAADELRAVSRRRASGDAVNLGTDAARQRRADSVAAVAVAPGPCADFFSPLRSVDWSRAPRCYALERGKFGPWTEAQAVMRAGHAQARAEAPGVFALWQSVMRAAELRGRKWARGTHSSAKGAASRAEIGAAAAADDMGDFWERLTGEAVAIFRHCAAGRVALLLAHLQARGIRVNRSARRALAWLPASGQDGRALAERWEYSAIKGRDGREVGGGFAMQGAVHGLRDFAFSAPVDHSTDDMGADEWAAALDTAAARLGMAPTGEAGRAAELVKSGYTPRLAAALAADEFRGAEDAGAAEDAACVDLGALAWAPNAGAGSGLRPSIRAALGAMAEAIRAADEDKARGATAQAAASAARATARASDIVGGLFEWVASGGAVDSVAVADFLGGGTARAAFTDKQRKALERLRKRYAGHFQAGKAPARAAEARPASRLASAAGDEIAGTLPSWRARRVKSLVKQARAARALAK
jgi:hypothetical protein